ncbi:GAF domain-containing protein [Streptomyces albidoflavus]
MAGETEFPEGARADGLPAALSDPARLAAVRATGLLDTGPEPVFEDLATLAARITGAGRAFVTLVDEERSYWKSCVGVDVTGGRETPVRESFCYFLVGFAGDPFMVEDAEHDPRTRDHPGIGPMKIGAWAGYPLLGPDGEVLGSFCVVDEAPRAWTAADRATLATLSRSASAEIHLRQSLAASQHAHRLSADLAHTLQRGLLPPALRPSPDSTRPPPTSRPPPAPTTTSPSAATSTTSSTPPAPTTAPSSAYAPAARASKRPKSSPWPATRCAPTPPRSSPRRGC